MRRRREAHSDARQPEVLDLGCRGPGYADVGVGCAVQGDRRFPRSILNRAAETPAWGVSRERIAVLIRPRFTHPKQRDLVTSDDKPQRPPGCVWAGQRTLLTGNAKSCKAANHQANRRDANATADPRGCWLGYIRSAARRRVRRAVRTSWRNALIAASDALWAIDADLFRCVAAPSKASTAG